MISKKLFILILLLPFLFSNCSSDSGNGGNSIDTPLNFGSEVSKNFSGQIVDENNNALPNVAITISNKTATTDVNGIFIINSATVHEKFAYITAKKAGFIDGSRSLIPTSGFNNVKNYHACRNCYWNCKFRKHGKYFITKWIQSYF